MIAFEHYTKIKNNYCVGYFGFYDGFLKELHAVRPFIERAFPGINLYIACKDESLHVLGNTDRIVKLSELKVRKGEFANYRELWFDGFTHPVAQFLEESGLASPSL